MTVSNRAPDSVTNDLPGGATPDPVPPREPDLVTAQTLSPTLTTQTLEIPAVRLPGTAKPAVARHAKQALPSTETNTATNTAARPFARVAFLLATLVFAVCALVGAFTHVQTYRNPEVAALLNGNGWGGITPNVTTLDEAVALLNDNPWVRETQVRDGKISWWWNGQQPGYLDDSGRAFHGRIETALSANGQMVVTALVLNTRLRLGDIRLTRGEPDVTTLYTIGGEGRRAGAAHVAEYGARRVEPSGERAALRTPRADLVVFNLLDCPSTVATFWNAPTSIAFGQPNLGLGENKMMRKGMPLNTMALEWPICG